MSKLTIIKKNLEQVLLPQFPELDEIVDKLVNEIATRINFEAKQSKSTTPYKAQYILEEIIKKLEKAV